MNVRLASLLVSIAVLGLACSMPNLSGSRTSPTSPPPGPTSSGVTPSPTVTRFCRADADRITTRKDQVRLVDSGATLQGCNALNSGEELAADSGGEADVNFVHSANCRISQLESPRTKAAHLISRDPPGTVFRLTDGEAWCAMTFGSQSTFCGKVTLLDTGAFLEVRVKCNSDPFTEIAVYEGTAEISVDVPAGNTKTEVTDGKQLHIDLATGEETPHEAAFSRQEIELLHSQALALAEALGVRLGCEIGVTADPASLEANGDAPSTIMATVTGCSPVEGDAVSFTLGKAPQACGRLRATSGATNISGQVKVTYLSSTTSGTCLISASEANTGNRGSVIIVQNPRPTPTSTS